MFKKLSFLLDKACISLSDLQKKQLTSYIAILSKWNKTYNLISARNSNEILIRHILDSVIIASYLQGYNFIDVGTGPGLPGVPLSIILPNLHFILLDSLGKRIRFLRQVQYELQLKNITLIHSRVEVFMYKYLCDGIISRAFSSLDNTLSLCKHLFMNSTKFYALKGKLPNNEINQISKDFVIESIIKLQVPNLHEERHLLIIKNNLLQNKV